MAKQGTREKFDRQRVERVARMYGSNGDAALALGIAPGSFSRLCARYGIESPSARAKRKRRAHAGGYQARGIADDTPPKPPKGGTGQSKRP